MTNLQASLASKAKRSDCDATGGSKWYTLLLLG